MTDKKIKNKQNAEVMSQEDIQLYRLFMIFGVAILGFAGLRLIPEHVFSRMLGVGRWIALALLGFIGGKMLIESLHPDCDEERAAAGECTMTKPLAFGALTVQAIATSIDALSVGFTISDYNFLEALLSVAIIALVTFPICLGGILIGRKFGSRLSNKAGILGGSILIFIGLEIFITSWF